jgi:hypothetical protein
VRARFKLLGWNVRFMSNPENSVVLVIPVSSQSFLAAGGQLRAWFKKEREFYRDRLMHAIVGLRTGLVSQRARRGALDRCSGACPIQASSHFIHR